MSLLRRLSHDLVAGAGRAFTIVITAVDLSFLTCRGEQDMSQERSVAALLAGYLPQAGVGHVFGYPGESLVEFIEEARTEGPQVVSAVREASAAFMAEGAAMRTGTVGACLSTLGPGSTALLNGVASAQLDRVPLLAVSGQVDSSREQFWTHQLIDHNRLSAPVTKLTARLDAASADTVLRRALRTATAERPGAVHLTVTMDSFGMSGTGTEGNPQLPPLAAHGAGLEFYGEEARCAAVRRRCSLSSPRTPGCRW